MSISGVEKSSKLQGGGKNKLVGVPGGWTKQQSFQVEKFEKSITTKSITKSILNNSQSISSLSQIQSSKSVTSNPEESPDLNLTEKRRSKSTTGRKSISTRMSVSGRLSEKFFVNMEAGNEEDLPSIVLEPPETVIRLEGSFVWSSRFLL